jgi:hypothetical protein
VAASTAAPWGAARVVGSAAQNRLVAMGSVHWSKNRWPAAIFTGSAQRGGTGPSVSHLTTASSDDVGPLMIERIAWTTTSPSSQVPTP